MPKSNVILTADVDVVTADATVTTLTNIVTTAGVLYDVVARIRGFSSTGVEACSYGRTATAKNVAGVLTLVGAVGVIGTDRESTVGLDATVDVDAPSQNIRVRVTGLAATSIRWRADLETKTIQI
jgi:hypothetical protein